MKDHFRTIIWVSLFVSTIFFGCSKDDVEETPTPKPPPDEEEPIPFDIENLNDTYGALAPLSNSSKWGPYNTHDPSILKIGEYFYSYSTDAGYGIDVPPGIQIRKSKDLVDWKFVGWALSSSPQQGINFIKSNGGTPFNSYWAPYIIKVGDELRLYYSLSSPTPRLSVIGLLTSTNPEGPWTERGLAVTSTDNPIIQTNAIDPTVIVDTQGQHWMYYGSAWDGIYILKLNPATGLAAVANDKGKRIAQRGFTGNTINGNIEGPEIIYNEQLGKYFLFISYDWLESKYNVRVGRSDSPEGPFYDYHGKDLNVAEDNSPMIIAPYKFKNHGGWQGTAHPAVFKDNNNQFYIAHQGRPGVDRFFMVMHVRKIFWTEDGWPIASPERYAGTAQTPVLQTELVGAWERIVLGYRVVPGYADTQTSPDFQLATDIFINDNGTINNGEGTWTYASPWLTLTWNNGLTDKVIVERGRDWENKKQALVFSGLNSEGTAVWGKK